MRDDRRGMVFVELIVSVLPFLLIVLGLAQLMLLEAGKLVVMRAASAAARAAVVVLDDDPRVYGGEPRNHAPAGSRRRKAIESAAAGALVASDPPSRSANLDDTVMNAVAVPARSTPLPALLAPSATLLERVRVSFPDHPDGSFAPDGAVTVRVEHDFPCLVPVGRRVLCDGGRGRHRTLSSTASLPNQGAPYAYGAEAP